MGYDTRGNIPQSLAYHLLDIAISDMVDNAIDAVLSESWRFHI